MRDPLLMLAGGSGIVPIMCMLRHRRLTRSAVSAALLYSCRTRADVIYHDELREMAKHDPTFALHIMLTRDHASGWPGGFAEAGSALLLRAGQPPESIRTERFGPTGA